MALQKMNNDNFSSIRDLNLTFCQIDQAKWLNKSWQPHNTAQFLIDCLNLLNSQMPNWYLPYLNDAQFSELHPLKQKPLKSKVRYCQLSNGIWVKSNFDNNRTCIVLLKLIDELGIKEIPHVIYSQKYHNLQAA